MGSQERASNRDRIRERLEEAFAPYRNTLTLLDELHASRSYTYEFIVLACARLDALANLGRRESSREAFVNFVTRYGAQRAELKKISVPDLARKVIGYLWVLPGTIPEPGRLELLTESDAPLIDVIEQSGLPVTEDDVGEFLSCVLAALQLRFRIAPRQPKRKPSLVSVHAVMQAVSGAAASYRRGRYMHAVNAIEPLAREASGARLLYRNYRSGAIHEHGFEVDERGFYRASDLYWRTVYRHPVTELPAGLELQFPASYLRRLLESSLESYSLELINRAKIPAGLFFDLFDLEDVDLLDESTLPEGKTIGFGGGRRRQLASGS